MANEDVLERAEMWLRDESKEDPIQLIEALAAEVRKLRKELVWAVRHGAVDNGPCDESPAPSALDFSIRGGTDSSGVCFNGTDEDLLRVIPIAMAVCAELESGDAAMKERSE